ncbi:4Fe-4S dicluster domain-containing protein [Candidatus Sumerlaeota bacterium]|nr:4Fe-4S dicluster domain-containing protein [Candidatus Sumerlaeota bacterium]
MMPLDMIDSRELDPNFKFQIAREEGGEGILKCYACGSCTARCPEQKVKPEYNPREVIRKALLGLKDETFRSEFVWICSAHYLCLSKCPQNVNIKAVMNAVRECRITEETYGRKKQGDPENAAIDPNFKYAIVEQECGKDLYQCFACGACTAGCPERSLDEKYSPRMLIRKILVGIREEVFENEFVNICSTHFRCLNECPQKVEIPKLMAAIRRLAEKEGYTREGVKVEITQSEPADKKKKKDKPERVFLK